jgi:hypothetical protein
LGVPDSPLQRVSRSGGTGEVAGRELRQSRPYVADSQVTQWPRPDDLQYWFQQPRVRFSRPLGPPVQPSRSQSSTARHTVYPVDDLPRASTPWCTALSLSRTSCLVLPETFRRIRLPSAVKPSETAPRTGSSPPRNRSRPRRDPSAGLWSPPCREA